MTIGLRPRIGHTLAAAGGWLFLSGVFLMVTGDGPSSMMRPGRWPTPLPALAWPWLYLVLIVAGPACLALGGAVPSWRPESLRRAAPAVAGLLAAFLLSVVFSPERGLSLRAYLLCLAIAALVWLMAMALERDELAARTWPTLACALLLLAARVVLWRRDEGLDVVAYQVLNNAWAGKLQLAWVFNLFAPLMLARAIGQARWPATVLYGASWVASGAATYLLFSRMGTIVFAGATLGLCLLNRAHWRRWLVVMVVAGVLASGLLLRGVELSRRVLATTFESDRNPGVGIRVSAWRDALRIFRAHPATGTGIGTFDEFTYRLPDTTADPQFRLNGWHAHNVYLHLLAETGVIGLTAWCVLWYAIVARLVRASRTTDAERRLATTGVLGAVLAFLALSTTEVLIGARVHASLRMNLTIGLVVVLGLGLATSADRR